MKKIKVDSQNELEMLVLNYLVAKYDVPVSQINEPFDATIADVAQEISEYLVDLGFAKVEEFECPEGCTGCDEIK